MLHTKRYIQQLTFNGFPSRMILQITQLAQKLLLEENPQGFFPIPFINNVECGSNATFKCKEMADKVRQLVEQVITHDFPISSIRIIMNTLHLAIDEGEEDDFIIHVEGKMLFLLHPDEGYAESTIERMIEILEKYMIPHPIVLLTELLSSCTVKLSEDEMLMIPCEMQTFLKPIHSKEVAFFKDFNRVLSRIKKTQVECRGMDFYEVKGICKEINVNGVYFFITPDHVELTGLPFNTKNFSDILKRRIREQQTESLVLSRK
jgi:hypothetical protein